MGPRILLLALAAALLFGTLLNPWTAPAEAWAAGAPAVSEEGGEHEAGHDDGHGEGGHSDPFANILLSLAILVLFALLGRTLAARLDQPTVLGELAIGMVLGNIGYHLLGDPLAVLIMHLDVVSAIFTDIWQSDLPVAEAVGHLTAGTGKEAVILGILETAPVFLLVAFAVWIFSNLGVILLLFMVGLESSVEEMVKVGPRALSVAMVGIVAPFGLGYWSSLVLLPDAGQEVHLFLGATLCATSVGITARVFKDLGRLQTPEAQIILGAAVIDDVLGLIILAVVVGIVATGGVALGAVLKILLLSAVFLGAVLLLGDRLSDLTASLVSITQRPHAKLLIPLSLAFFMAWLANQIELATIVGAFAAGMVLKEEHFRTRKRTIEAMVDPLEAIFAPIFFLLMGMQVNLASFLEAETLKLSFAFIVVAIVGKVVSGWPAGSDMDRLSVGLGMMPRGEVGLIFASIGKNLGVVTDGTFSAVVLMVLVTTLAAPLCLKWSLARSGH